MKRSALARAAVAAVGVPFIIFGSTLESKSWADAPPGTMLQVGMPTYGSGGLSLAPSIPQLETGGGSLQLPTQAQPAADIIIPVNSGTPFTINLNVGPTLAANPAALGAFERAAGAWTSVFRDPVTVNINADLAPLPTNVIGSTSSVFLVGDYTTVRNAMVADAANDPGRDSIVGSLPTAPQFSAFLPANGNITLSGGIETTKAAFKAQGFTGLDAQFGDSDASITFSTLFPFDFNRSDGTSPLTIDFQTVATHEIGHALGFISSVDVVDAAVANNLSGQLDIDALDLYRFALSHNNPTTPAEFTSDPRDLLSGDEAVTNDTDNQYRMSTGQFTGDGHQASHWKDDAILGGPYIGIMDPTLSFATQEDLQPSDIRALDLIGWDVVPEPASAGLLFLGALALLRRRER